MHLVKRELGSYMIWLKGQHEDVPVSWFNLNKRSSRLQRNLLRDFKQSPCFSNKVLYCHFQQTDKPHELFGAASPLYCPVFHLTRAGKPCSD